MSGPTLAFAGRLTAQKSLGVALEAVAASRGVSLLLAGDGPERAALERQCRGARARRPRPLPRRAPRDDVLDALPRPRTRRALVELGELPAHRGRGARRRDPRARDRGRRRPRGRRDGENGLLVRAGDALRSPRAIERVFAATRALRATLAAGGGAVGRGARRSRACSRRIVERSSTAAARMKPRVLLVGRTRYPLPLDALARAQVRRARARSSTCACSRRAPRGAADGDATFTLAPGRPSRRSTGRSSTARCRSGSRASSGASGPMRCSPRVRTRRSRRSRGAALARSDGAVILDVHGDWRTDPALRLAARGASSRRSATARRVAIRQADGVRTLSPFTSDSSATRASSRPPSSRLHGSEPFLEPPAAPLPDRPAALFVGVLERYKAVEALAAAWRLAAPRVPGATLHIVGEGRHRDLVERLVADLPERVRGSRARARRGRTGDGRRLLLLLPSRSEGLPRVVVEAFCRGRGGRRGQGRRDPRPRPDGESGLLVAPDDPTEIADALVRILTDRALAERLGDGGARGRRPWLAHRRRSTPTASSISSSGRRSASMKLVFVTQQVDPASPVLGATVAKLRALAAASTSSSCSPTRAVEDVLPANCRVRLFERDRRRGAGCGSSSALARELAPAAASERRARAHVPDLRGARGPARAAAPRAGPALVHALAREPPAPPRRAVSTA